jgi:phosphatidylglycerol:prolipoprotein diacylglycerol transferase
MHRILLTLPFGGGFPLFGYGVMLTVGFAVGLTFAWWRARRAGLSTDSTLDVGLIAIFAGVVGARIAYLLIDYQPIEGVPNGWREWIAVWQGGLTFQGGLFLALIADWAYLRRKRISVGKMFDIYAPSLAVGVGFGRIGCLLNGCCWGKIAPAGTWWSMVFPEEVEPMVYQEWMYAQAPEMWDSLIASLGYHADTLPPIPVYATQIVSAAGLFLIAAGLLWAERRWRGRPDGQVINWFLFAYAIGRFAIEFWREDTPLRYGFGSFPGLRLGQWLAVAMFAAALVIQHFLNRKRKALTAAGQTSRQG